MVILHPICMQCSKQGGKKTSPVKNTCWPQIHSKNLHTKCTFLLFYLTFLLCIPTSAATSSFNKGPSWSCCYCWPGWSLASHESSHLHVLIPLQDCSNPYYRARLQTLGKTLTEPWKRSQNPSATKQRTIFSYLWLYVNLFVRDLQAMGDKATLQ